MKRFFDIFVAILLLPIVIVVCGVFSILIFMESPGNPLFFQKRVGKGEKVFTLWKMRSMVLGTDNLATHEVSSSKITPIGRFIRRTKIDELPQVINILLGQMSLVGPRPCLPNQIDLIESRRSRGVFLALPGITGLAQVSGIDMSKPDFLASIDADYVESQSLLGDVKLIVQTATGRGQGDAVRFDHN